LLKIGLFGAHAALPGGAGRRRVRRNGIGVLLAHAVNLSAQDLRGRPQRVVGRVFQGLIQQRQRGRVIAVIIQGRGLRIGHALVGSVQLGAAVVDAFEVSQRLRVVGG